MSAPPHQQPFGLPWGIPPNFAPEVYQIPATTTTIHVPIMIVPPPAVHIVPHFNETIYYAAPSESLGVCERMNDFEDQFQEMQKEIKDLRGKDLFGRNAHDLCLVPDVQVPAKIMSSKPTHHVR